MRENQVNPSPAVGAPSSVGVLGRVGKRRRRPIVSLARSVVLGLAVAVIHLSGLTLALDKHIYDLWFQLAEGADGPARHVVLVAIDDRSLAEGGVGQWPWRSERIGELVAGVRRAGASAVGLDILLDRPRDETDRQLAGHLREWKNVILAANLRGSSNLSPRVEMDWPLPGLLEPDRTRTGFCNFVEDRPDGSIRSVKLAIGSGDEVFYSFPLLLALAAEGRRGADARIEEGRVVWYTDNGSRAEWPVITRIDFRRPSRIPTVSAVDVLRGRVPREVMAGKVVLVGGTASGEFTDLFRTPFYDDLVTGTRSGMHGVRVQANAVETLLSDTHVREACSLAVAAAGLLVALAACAVMRAVRPVFGLLAAVGFILGSGLVCMTLFASYRLEVSLMPFTLAAVGAYVIAGLEKYEDAENRRRRAQTMFEVLEFYRDRVFHKMGSQVMLVRYALEESGERSPSGVDPHIPESGLRHLDVLSDYLDNLRLADVVRQEEAVPEFEPVDLGQMVALAADDFRRAYERAGLLLTVNAADYPIVVSADSSQVRVVLDTFLENGLKYVPPTGRHVRVGVRADGGDAVVEVEDDGPGISPDGLKQIFDPFFRERSAQTERAKGMGLGLFIAKAIVDKHRGSLEVLSELGQGTTFALRLPLLTQAGERREHNG